MTFTVIEHAELYAPEPLGEQALLIAGTTIARIGNIDRRAVEALDPEAAVLDARGCVVIPGLIDPHEHLIGAAGEQGFGSRMPEVSVEALLKAGITTTVGCLGTDTTTRNLPALLGKVRELEAQGLTSYMYTGGFPVPTPTITGSITDDLVIVDKVIGVGEIAISDFRSSEPTLAELANLVSQAIVGGLVGGKAGVTHFHVGEGSQRLKLLRELLDQHEIPSRYLYPTHISRSSELMEEAIALAQRGAPVDVDAVENNASDWLAYYRAHGGPSEQLTVSSDAQTTGSAPGHLYESFVDSVHRHGLRLDEALPHYGLNAARALQLNRKGRLRVGADADLVVLDRTSLAIRHVFARGAHLLRDGQVHLQSGCTD
jgi:beta-aspartyl-dipeptidase (metallo-type)